MCKPSLIYKFSASHNLTRPDYISNYARPVAIIVDGSSTEDRPFLDGLKDQLSDSTKSTLIELPTRSDSRLSWISHLDATALTGKWGQKTVVVRPMANSLYSVE